MISYGRADLPEALSSFYNRLGIHIEFRKKVKKSVKSFVSKNDPKIFFDVRGEKRLLALMKVEDAIKVPFDLELYFLAVYYRIQ